MNKMRVAITLIIISTFIFLQLTNNIPAQGAAQATIEVTTLLDTLADDGLCSLREAVRAANLDIAVGGCPAGAGVDTVQLSSGTYTLEIPGRDEDEALSGDLDIQNGLVLIGDGGTILDGGGLDRVLHITDYEISVILRDLTIQNGVADPADLLGGGGILSLGSLYLEDVELLNNVANRGGGVRNSLGDLNISDCLIQGNEALTEGGGIYGDGPILIERSRILNNQARFGGGVNSDQETTFNTVSLIQNSASEHGGGFFNDTSANMQGVLFEGNSAPQGAGIYNNHTMSLSNVTFSGNISEHSSFLVGRGGAIYNTSLLDILYSTLYGNIAEQGGGLYNAEDGIITLKASILASSQGGNCVNFDQLISLGYNISDDALCNLNGIGDRTNSNPRLESLADNLGFTQTHALQVSSPALDNGPEEGCPTTDQRGVIRSIDGDRNGAVACDIGAFEHAPGGILQFETVTQAVEESDGSLQVWVSRFEGDGAIGVEYKAGIGTAHPGSDFDLVPGSLSWASNDHAAKAIPVQILEDEYREDDEVGAIYITKPTGQAGLLSPNERFRLVILANDPEGPPQPGGPVFLPLIQH